MDSAAGVRTYRIAYITADWNRELVSVALNSLNDYMRQHGNVRAQVFNCFGFALHSDNTRFRYKIYELANLSDFDAVIIQAHQIMDSFALSYLEEQILRAGIPAISIGARMKGCTYIGTDDYAASSEIAEHLLTVHGAKSFIYLKGAERDGYGEAFDRRRAFEDACRRHGIPKENIRLFNGDWQAANAAFIVEELIDNEEELPDAIVAANDEMALGAIGVLQDAGIRVPEDILVTGFDDIFSASLSEPRLSTIIRDFYRIVQTTCEVLIGKLEGREMPECIFSPMQPLFSESCGCTAHTEVELRGVRASFYAHKRRMEEYYYLQDKLTAGLFGALGPKEIMDKMEECYEIFGSPGMYVYFNDFYVDSFSSNDTLERNESRGSFSDHFMLVGCGGRNLDHDERHVYMRIPREHLTDAPILKDEQFTIFYPMHFEGTMIGFLVLTSPPKVMEMNLHENLVNLFVFAMENSRQKMLTTMLNERLAALSVTDPLTGLYNRFGYARFAKELFNGMRDEGNLIRVLFLDVDNMKTINDKHGHENGDLALKTVSRVIRDSCRKSDFKMRYGGDEFVIITDSGEADIKGRLKKNLAEVNGSGELPFCLNVSIGDYSSEAGSEDSLDSLLIKADELMYREKTLRKSS